MRCERCESDMPINAKFCINCGEANTSYVEPFSSQEFSAPVAPPPQQQDGAQQQFVPPPYNPGQQQPNGSPPVYGQSSPYGPPPVYGQPPPYGQPPYNPYYNQHNPEAEKAATASLICAIISFFVAGIILGIVAITQGNKAKKMGYTGGKATVGIVLGILGIISGVISSAVMYSWM